VTKTHQQRKSNASPDASSQWRGTCYGGCITKTLRSTVSGKAPSNDDIANLKTAGFTDELIIAEIKTSPTSHKMDTDDLLASKKAGLSDVVISATVSAQVLPGLRHFDDGFIHR
jgi:hypothetical protein